MKDLLKKKEIFKGDYRCTFINKN